MMTQIDYSSTIPNNVNLNEDRKIQRALEKWQPAFLNWWENFGPNWAAKDDIFLRMYYNIDFKGKWIWNYRIPFRLMYYREYISDIVSIDRSGFRTDFTILNNSFDRMMP